MSNFESKLKEVEREILKLAPKLHDLEREEQRAKLAIVKASGVVTELKRKRDAINQEIQSAEEQLHKATEEQSDIAKEKATLTAEVTRKGAEKLELMREIDTENLRKAA